MMKLLLALSLTVALGGVASAQTYQYQPNPIGGGGTIYGPGGATTRIQPNPLGGGYTTYGSDGSMGRYQPNPIGGGGTLYVTPGIAPAPPPTPPPAVNLSPDLSVYKRCYGLYC
jgi:hypothetical protein